MLPLRQKTEFGTLKEVVLGRTDKSAFPPKCKANANFTDHIEDLGPDFYDQFEENELIPAKDVKPELVEAYDKLQADLTKTYESEGVTATSGLPMKRTSSWDTVTRKARRNPPQQISSDSMYSSG